MWLVCDVGGVICGCGLWVWLVWKVGGVVCGCGWYGR